MTYTQFHHVDHMFIKNLKDILNEEWEQGTRAKWEDTGEYAKTKRILQVVNRYDLSKGFPISQLRKINYKAAINEVLWIYQRMSNNIKDLNSSIWNSWADDSGNIQKAYGYQIAKSTMGHPSQIHYVLHEIKNNPTSRRIMMNMFNAEDQYTKATESLIECAYSTHFSVKDGRLHMTLIQRSGDFLTACGSGGWNLTQYAFLQHAIAKECGLDVGVLTHFVQDLHLYDQHEEIANKLIERYENTESLKIGSSSSHDPLPVPHIKIADKPFFELTEDDVTIENYFNLGSVGKIPVAV